MTTGRLAGWPVASTHGDTDMTTLPDPSPPANGLADGECRRDAALAQLAATRSVIMRRLQRATVRIALDMGTVTADDVRAVVPIPPRVNPKANGAALRFLADCRILVSVGWVRSERPAAHARKIERWAIADRAAAVEWLASHSEPELPGGGQS